MGKFPVNFSVHNLCLASNLDLGFFRVLCNSDQPFVCFCVCRSVGQALADVLPFFSIDVIGLVAQYGKQNEMISASDLLSCVLARMVFEVCRACMFFLA